MGKQKFNPEPCEHCSQNTKYLLGLDKGSAKIVLAILETISKKGVNEIHPARELDVAGAKKWYLTNLSRPRFHGLIAYIEEKKGFYCLTRKAGKFFRNQEVDKFAIISKVTGHQEGYFEPGQHLVRLSELLKQEIMWEGDTKSMIDRLDPQESVNGRLF